MKKYKPTLLANVPSLYQLLLNTKKFKRIDHSSIDVAVSAASPFPVESQKQLESIIGEGKLLEVNPYYTHDFGKFVPELLKISEQVREITFGGEGNE